MAFRSLSSADVFIDFGVFENTGMKLLKLTRGGFRVRQFGPFMIQTATLMSRETRGEPLVLPKPFPYTEKKFRWYHEILDPTIVKTSQENARIVVVEGPIGVGKTAFCKVLAEQFDMLYIPQATMDYFYKLPSGYDLRQHDDEVPERVRTYDHKNFCVNPVTTKAGLFQTKMLEARFYQYMDAMCHILNTGQGVVLERSYYSDYVFMKAMREQNYVSEAMSDAYNTIKTNTSTFFSPPYLVIYLDISVPEVQDRIRTRNYSYEQDSPALTEAYLTSLEKFWKQDYLKNANAVSDILIYDWSDGGDVDVVIDDIEKLNLDCMRPDKKFFEWRISRKDLFRLRQNFTNYVLSYEQYFYHPWYNVEEAFIPFEEMVYWDRVFEKIPECQYDIGYNYLMGDSKLKILFKSKQEKHRFLRRFLGYCTQIDNPALL